MRPDKYILVDGIVVAIDPDDPGGLMRWGMWMEKSHATGERIVKQENVCGFWVSTVFLGLDHQHGDGPPILFETMVFEIYDPPITMHGRTWDRIQSEDFPMDRYSTREDAEAGHVAMVELVRRSGLQIVNGS